MKIKGKQETPESKFDSRFTAGRQIKAIRAVRNQHLIPDLMLAVWKSVNIDSVLKGNRRNSMNIRRN
eukprot:7390825-Karenia_brevis.AAC.1